MSSNRIDQSSHGSVTSLNNDDLQDVDLELNSKAVQKLQTAYSVSAQDILQQTRKLAQEAKANSRLRMNPVILAILMTEAAERFAFYGFRASLVLYFTQELDYDDNTAITLFAYATFVANFTPICGAILGDSFLGRFRTIVYFGFIYWIGLIVLTYAAFFSNTTAEQLETKRVITMIGLALICAGTGGIKPCVPIFGADQVTSKPDATDDSTRNKENSCDKRKDASNSSRSDDQDKVRTFFSFFSMCVNLGAVASFVIIPTVKGRFGFGVAFLFPTAFMCLAIIVFLSKRHSYVYREHNQNDTSLYTTFRLCLWLLHNNVWSYKFVSDWFPCLRPGPVPLPRLLPPTVEHPDHSEDGNSSVSSISVRSRSLSKDRLGHNESREREPWEDEMDSSERTETSQTNNETHMEGMDDLVSVRSLQTSDKYLAKELSDAARALNVIPVLAMLPCFWMMYDQQGSVWTLQASRMNLHDWMQPEQINVLNPIGLFVLIPIFDKWIYPFLERRGIDISPLRRIGWGMILVAVAFFISGCVEYVIDYRIENGLEPIIVAYQIPQIVLMTVAEIFISVTGLEFAYSVSPDRLKSFVMAAYLMTIAKGDFWGGLLYSTVFRDLNQALVLHIFAMMMLINLLCYGYVVRSWELRHGLVSWELFDKILETESQRTWNDGDNNNREAKKDETQATDDQPTEAQPKDKIMQGRGRLTRRPS